MPKPSTPSPAISSGTVTSAAMAGSAEPERFQRELRNNITGVHPAMESYGHEGHGQGQAKQHHGPEFDNGCADQQRGNPEQHAGKSGIGQQRGVALQMLAMAE